MSIADELEKLNDLKERKIISELDFEQQKQNLLKSSTEQKNKPSFFKRKSVRLFLGLVGVILLIDSLSDTQTTGTATTAGIVNALPACDDDDAIGALENAIANNPTSNITTLRLLDTENLQEVSYDNKKKIRRCKGVLTLNSGKEAVQYELSEASTGGLLVWVEPLE